MSLTSRAEACHEDACSVATLTYEQRDLVAKLLEQGLDALKGYAAPTYEALEGALRRCVRDSCIAHGDAGDVVDELQTVIDENDALDEQWQAELEDRYRGEAHGCGGCSACSLF